MKNCNKKCDRLTLKRLVFPLKIEKLNVDCRTLDVLRLLLLLVSIHNFAKAARGRNLKMLIEASKNIVNLYSFVCSAYCGVRAWRACVYVMANPTNPTNQYLPIKSSSTNHSNRFFFCCYSILPFFSEPHGCMRLC